MQLLSYEFQELDGSTRAWSVDRFDVETVNLFVGVNSSGKTRILNTIDVLAKIVSGRNKALSGSARWQAVFRLSKRVYELEIEFRDSVVFSESLIVDGKPKIKRAGDGTATIWYHQLNDFIAVKAKPDDLLIATRQDELQHPYLEELSAWADKVRLYLFSSDLGRRQLWLFRDTVEESSASENKPAPVTDQNNVVEQYVTGWLMFKEAFDVSILKDFKKVGYPCTEISASNFENAELSKTIGKLPLQLTVQEKSLKSITGQVDMSTGMWRALAIIIHLNFLAFSKSHSTVLLDDVGEGLDYERAAALVRLVISKCTRNRIQVIMTSNDRFVMNAVDLSYWHLITRKSSRVKVIDRHTAKESFERFPYLGLSNFDFFKSQAHD